MSKIKILLFVSYYSPGYKAGGPIRTIQNLVEALSSEFDFWIVTRDRDLGDFVPYRNVPRDEWVSSGSANILYLSPERLSFSFLIGLAKEQEWDLVYLNSFFDVDFSVKLMALRFLGQLRTLPFVIAPRGEFGGGALSIKSYKKKLFISVARLFGLHHSVIWQASSKMERRDIMNALKLDSEELIFIAKDLPEKYSKSKVGDIVFSGVLKCVFLSRISPMKNLDFALRVLRNVNFTVEFDIYGPIEDPLYWKECQKVIQLMPENVRVQYMGEVKPSEVKKVFVKYHLFLFPTKGENYGHVIAESLSVGTPVLTSNQTLWKALQSDNLGWDLDLADGEEVFAEKVKEFCNELQKIGYVSRERVAAAAYERIYNEQDVSDNKALFLKAIKHRRKENH